MRNKDIRVIHLPTTVGGNPQGISASLNRCGFLSRSLTLKQNYFGYPADLVVANDHDGRILVEWKRLWALKYVFQYDVVFFNFGQSLFSPPPPLARHKRVGLRGMLYCLARQYFIAMQKLEFLLLRFLKRVVFIQYQGDDARQGLRCLEIQEFSIASQVDDSYYSQESDSHKRDQIALMDGLCERIYTLNPDLKDVLPARAEFLPYSHISLDEWLPVYSQAEERVLRIGHAPSHRLVKGTQLIIDALSHLGGEGHEFELVLVEGMSHSEAKELYKSIDVMVDQLFAGWYGGLGVELMALGKPVITYIREDDLLNIPSEMAADLPVIRASPTSIRDVLRRILSMERKELVQIGKRSRSFVEKWHNPDGVAARIKRDINEVLG